MTPSRWQQIEAIYHATLERAPAARSVYLEQACSGDHGLRREVESLLAQDLSRENALDRPAWEGAAALTDAKATVTLLAAGMQLGPYRIEGQLGKGGMGEVFRAVDARLGRLVAIKTSQEQFNERFEREARAISALNHPHICTLYDVGATASGTSYLVMELVEGESLAARLKRGKLSISETLKYGQQIAGALAAAHAKGIIHRDLKPPNIMLAKAGVKVLDFGLAKAPQDITITASNVVMGTPAYMAPEQVEGNGADARTDIYALGLILFEMATGKRPPKDQFPPIDELPEQFAHVLERCLARDPGERWQAASDVHKELMWAESRPKAAVAGPRFPVQVMWGVTGVGAFALLALAWTRFDRVPETRAQRSAEFTLSFAGETVGAAAGSIPIPSPDGRYSVFGGTTAKGPMLWLRPVDSGEAHPIAGTEGAVAGFWSPDSRWIGFFADQKLRKISVAGNVAETIASLASFQDGIWGSNGDILFRPANRTPLWRIRDTGGPATQLTELDASKTENSHRAPRFLPDGKHFLFISRCGERTNNALYVGSLDSPNNVRRLMATQANVSYVQSKDHGGLLLFYRDGGIWAQAFDPKHQRLSGESFNVIPRVAYNPTGIEAYFATDADGSLIVFRSAESEGTRLRWFTRDGDPGADVFSSPSVATQPRISPDGTQILFSGTDPQSGNRDLFSVELARGVVSRLTTHVANDWFPVWAPDGRKLVFGSDRAGGPALVAYLKRGVESGSEESILQPGVLAPLDWSRDGKWILYQTSKSGGPLDGDIAIASAAGDRKPFEYLATPFREGGARFSPDSRWIAYSSDESGRFEIYARPFDGGPAGTTGKIQLSNGGGDYPVWRSDGRELYYVTRAADVFAVSTANLGPDGPAPVPTKLFHACPDSALVDSPMTGQFYGWAFDTRDGQRFLLKCMIEPPGRFAVLLNWTLEPKQ